MVKKIMWVSVADLHLKLTDKWGNINPETGLNTRLEDRLSNLKYAVQYALKKKVDYFIIAGDVFDSLHPGELLRSLFFDVVGELGPAGIEIIILIGNHDTDGKVFNFVGESTNAYYDNIRNLTIVSEYTELGDHLVFVPFGQEYKIPDVKKKARKVLFGHLVIDKAKVGSENYGLQSQYPLSMLKEFAWFELGDIHKPQPFRNGCYIGSIAKKDFGEAKEKKGFRYGKFVLNMQGVKASSEFVSVSDRRFVQLDVTEKNVTKLLTGLNIEEKDAVLKVVVTGTRDWIRSVRWNDYRINLKTLCSLVRFEFKPIAEKEVTLKRRVLKLDNLEGAVTKYAQENNFTKSSLKFGLELLAAED